MKKFVASVLLISTVIWGVSIGAGDEPVVIPVHSNAWISSCNANETENVYYYLPVEGLSVSDISDTFWNSVDSLIWWGGNGSSIDIRRNWVISQCNAWNRVSNVVSAQDSNWALIFLNTDKCVFGIPNYTKENNGNMIDAQIHYTVWYRKIYNWWPNTLTDTFLYYRDKWVNKWTCYSNWQTVSDFKNCPKITVKYWDQNYHTWECLNYRVFRCGDGLVNRPNWSTSYNNWTYSEACDPESSERKNRSDWKRCNSSCQIEEDETPVCSSEYNNKKVYTTSSAQYLNWTETLCSPWIVQNFKPSGTPIKFTRWCKNWAKTTTSDACKFRQYRCGDGEINWWWDRNNFINGSHYEQCDPNHPDWKNRSDWQSCTSSCTIKYETSTCGSLNSTTAVYNPNYPTWRIKETDSWLCGVGDYVAWSLSYNKDTWKYTWKCKNWEAASASCSAQDLWCWDKKVNWGEQCDPNDPNKQWWEEWTWKTCNQSCQLENIPRVWPVCSSVYNWHTEYTSMTSTPWINSTTPWLCDKWTLVAWSFTYNWEPRNFSWKCTNDWLEVTCTAKQQWCWDWKKNWWEVCDYKDTTTQDGRWDWCSTTCDEKTYDSAKCWSAYHTHSRYLDINSSWIYSTTPWLCDKWTVINFDKHTDWSNHVYTWQCKNGTKVSEQCWADQQWCWDKEVNWNEQCDPNDPNKQWREEWTWKTCNQSCELKNVTRVDPVCNSTYNGKTKYTTTSALWINEWDSLCSVWKLVSWTFKYSGEPRDFTWACTNDWLVVNCEAHQQWCWDSEINNNETCDPNDPNEVNWWNDWCDQTCKPKNIAPSECDESSTFYYTLRHGWEYTFHDTFNAKSATRYLYDFDVDFVEEKDYNKWANPSFNWAENLINGVYIEVPEWTSKQVIVSSPKYKILDYPTVRSKNNLYIEYDIKWSNIIYPSKPDNSRLVSHKECAYYEISRCWDWKIDTEWEWKRPQDEPEQCDPGSAWTSVLPNWKICNSECKIVDAPSNWTPKIVKTLKEKVPVTQTGQVLTWIVEVTAEGWDVTDFEVKDYLPKVLKYEDYSVVSNPDKLTVTWPWTPVSSWNNNVYTWNVRWTLMSWHKLRMEIKSTVKTLVQVADDYLNVACVVDDWKEDCDEAKPNPENWKLEIVKTLESWEISKIWDPVVWKIKVTATWWNVTDFIITDKLPDILSYSWYTVTHKWSVDSITFWWENKQENSVTRNVVWTLNKWDYVEIRLVTKAKKIPTEEYVNVACVKSETNPEVCSEVPVGLLKITKTLLTNKYVETWDIVKWEIKVEAIGWNIGIDYIYDDLPRELWFTWYSISHIPSNITLWEAEPEMWWRKRIRWSVSWILNEWDYITLIVETEVLKVPEDEVKNIACVKPANQNEPKCDEAPIKEKPRVWIKKTFTDWSTTKNVKIWDNVSYKISFWNYSWTESTTITWISIKDFLPKTVSYISGTIHIETNSTHSTDTQEWNERIRWFKVVDGVHIEIYDWITLNPWDTWYIILTGKVMSASTDKDNRTNFACIFVNNVSIDCDGVHHDITKEEVMCDKMNVSPDEFDHLWWNATMSCYSKGWKAESIIIDCDNGHSYTGYNVSSLTKECIYDENDTTYSKIYYPKCFVNGETSPEEECKGKVTVKGKWNSSCFPAWTKVTMADGSKKNIEDVEIWDTVLSYNTDTNTNEWNVVQQTLVHTDNIHEMYEITVNWSILKVTDAHRFYVKKSLNANNFDWIEAKDLKIWDMLFMSNGNLVKIENIKHYNNKETVYNLEVKGNHNYYVDRWYLVHNTKGPSDKTPWCEKHPEDAICMNAEPKCFNLNDWNVSVEVWEFLPIYLNIKKDSWDTKHKFVRNITANEWGSCNNIGDVAINSMRCTYRILKPGKACGVYETEEEIKDCLYERSVYSETRECFQDNNQLSNASNLVQAWAAWQGDVYNGDMQTLDDEGTSYTYYPHIEVIKAREKTNWWDFNNKFGRNTLGEYQYQITNVTYLQCVDNEREERESVISCWNEFVLTEPYTVQKTPSWNLSASTDSLNKFKDVNWSWSFYDRYMTNITSTDYKANNAVKTAMDKFINKYEKLAVKVDSNKFWSAVVKKVPWKNIYFLSGNAKINGSDGWIRNPFTIVQTLGNTTISWDLNNNMMLLTRWTITFSWDCTSNQKVKWIFYAEWWLLRNWVLHNDTKTNGVWCDKWWLQIKWVLIWSGLNYVMDKSRSHLEDWFKTDLDERKNAIMNWASVLIEYSPSVFTRSTMPPGAEEFTTALSIYKN